MTDILTHNRKAWNKTASDGESPWVQPVTPEQIKAARAGQWSVVLTPTKPVPAGWFGDIKGKDVLGLASGGGQQVPIMAAAGARVTCLDNSNEMLARDKLVADREGLSIRLEQGDMADLSRFPDASFDVIFHPVSNVFVPDVLPVWREAFRVLRPGGRLLAGFMNPSVFMFDWPKVEHEGELVIKYTIPFADPTSLSEEDLANRIADGEPLEFSHTLETQIGGQIEAGFGIHGFFEDKWDKPGFATDPYMPCAFATLAVKP